MHRIKWPLSLSVPLQDHILCDLSSAFRSQPFSRHDLISKDPAVIWAMLDAEVLCSVCSCCAIEESCFQQRRIPAHLKP